MRTQLGPIFTRQDWLSGGGSVQFWNSNAVQTPQGPRVGGGLPAWKRAGYPPLIDKASKSAATRTAGSRQPTRRPAAVAPTWPPREPVPAGAHHTLADLAVPLPSAEQRAAQRKAEARHYLAPRPGVDY